MNGKISLILALVASLAVSSNLVGTPFADKFKDSGSQGSACQSSENRVNSQKTPFEGCDSFVGRDSGVLCSSSSHNFLTDCAKHP